MKLTVRLLIITLAMVLSCLYAYTTTLAFSY